MYLIIYGKNIKLQKSSLCLLKRHEKGSFREGFVFFGQVVCVSVYGFWLGTALREKRIIKGFCDI